MEGDVSIRINKKNHTELKKIKGAIQAKTGENITFDKVIEDLLKEYKKRRK